MTTVYMPLILNDWVVAEEEKKPMILGVDVSGWNPNIDWKLLWEGGVRFAIVKLTQGTSSVTNLAEDHIKKARDVGMVVAGYHWADPMMKDQAQIDFFASLLNKYNVKRGYIDCEQYWKSWQEFYDQIQHGIPITKFISPTRISQNAYNLITGIRNKGLLSAPYTRWSFITGRASPMQLWIPSEESWYAHYPYKIGRVNALWQDFLPGGKWFPTIPAPSLPSSVKWKIWQFSGDKFILPGTGGIPIDLNFYNGNDLSELIKYFNGDTIIQPPVPPTQPEPPTNGVILPTLKVINKVNVRPTPSTAIKETRTRQIGETVKIEEIKVHAINNIWVRDHEGWSAITYYGVLYMK